jgi:hypothetical protein
MGPIAGESRSEIWEHGWMSQARDRSRETITEVDLRRPSRIAKKDREHLFGPNGYVHN